MWGLVERIELPVVTSCKRPVNAITDPNTSLYHGTDEGFCERGSEHSVMLNDGSFLTRCANTHAQYYAIRIE
jgi:hypothetical protein